MPITLGAEVPGLFAQEFGNTAKNDALDHHLTVKVVVYVQPTHPLNGDAVQNNPAALVIHFPTFNDARNIGSRWCGGYVKVDVGKVGGPESAQVVDRVCDRDEKSVYATAEAWEVRSGGWPAHAATVTIAGESAVGHERRK